MNNDTLLIRIFNVDTRKSTVWVSVERFITCDEREETIGDYFQFKILKVGKLIH